MLEKTKDDISYDEFEKDVHPLKSSDDISIAKSSYSCGLTSSQASILIRAINYKRISDKESEDEAIRRCWEIFMVKRDLLKFAALKKRRSLDLEDYKKFIKELDEFRKELRLLESKPLRDDGIGDPSKS